MLRRWGMLTKKNKPQVFKLRLQKSILANGAEVVYTEPILKSELPINNQSMITEVACWVEWKKTFNSSCKFDAITQSCMCGKTLEQFAVTKTCKL